MFRLFSSQYYVWFYYTRTIQLVILRIYFKLSHHLSKQLSRNTNNIIDNAIFNLHDIAREHPNENTVKAFHLYVTSCHIEHSNLKISFRVGLEQGTRYHLGIYVTKTFQWRNNKVNETLTAPKSCKRINSANLSKNATEPNLIIRNGRYFKQSSFQITVLTLTLFLAISTHAHHNTKKNHHNSSVNKQSQTVCKRNVRTLSNWYSDCGKRGWGWPPYIPTNGIQKRLKHAPANKSKCTLTHILRHQITMLIEIIYGVRCQ